MTREQAQALTRKALSFAKVPEVSVAISVRSHGFLRFAGNAVTTSGQTQSASVSIRAWKGKRSGAVSASIDLWDNAAAEAALKKLVAEAEALAALSPEDPEYVPLLGPQKYIEVDALDSSSATMPAAARAAAASQAIAQAKNRKVVAAGFFENRSDVEVLANSADLFAYFPSSFVAFSVTARTADGTGSGYSSVVSHRAASLDVKEATALAAQKALDSRGARQIEPGAYPTILEPQAAADILSRINFDARLADEGRSAFTAPGGKTRLGEAMFDKRVNLYTDPQNAVVPSSPVGPEGYPITKADFALEGVVKNLAYSRFWAAKSEKQPGPFAANLILDGENLPLAKMIAATERGVLVTRLWYIRMVDPQQALHTGLTRDGTFWIEDGKIKHPIKNFRFNESPVRLLAQVEALGTPQPVAPSERYSTFRLLLPAVKVRSFRFTSLSDAV
jgi:predicted Zn-dependent protease